MSGQPDAVDWTATPLGTRFTGRSLALSLARVLAFSAGPLDEPGWPQRNLHTDRDKAREAGLEDIIASGTQSEGLLLGLLIELFDAHWYRGGELDVRFAKPVHVGDVVTPALVLQERSVENGGTRLTFACTCETRPGHVVIEGTATVTLHAPGDAAG